MAHRTIEFLKIMSIGIERDIVNVNKIGVEERAVLINKAGASIYTLTGKTIRDYIRAGRPVQYSVTCEGIVGLPSRLIEVAIFPDPVEFFVPGTDEKSAEEQRALVEKDSYTLLSEGLGLERVKLGFGSAADLTELFFRHFDEGLLRGEDWRLFGREYGNLSSRTQTPIDELGSDFAVVGGYSPVNGLWVSGLGGDGFRGVRVIRLVVPKYV